MNAHELHDVSVHACACASVGVHAQLWRRRRLHRLHLLLLIAGTPFTAAASAQFRSDARPPPHRTGPLAPSTPAAAACLAWPACLTRPAAWRGAAHIPVAREARPDAGEEQLDATHLERQLAESRRQAREDRGEHERNDSLPEPGPHAAYG